MIAPLWKLYSFNLTNLKYENHMKHVIHKTSSWYEKKNTQPPNIYFIQFCSLYIWYDAETLWFISLCYISDSIILLLIAYVIVIINSRLEYKIHNWLFCQVCSNSTSWKWAWQWIGILQSKEYSIKILFLAFSSRCINVGQAFVSKFRQNSCN